MKKSKVYKLIPSDLDQMSTDALTNFISELRVSLNQLLVRKNDVDFKKTNKLNELLGLTKALSPHDEYYFKMYSLEETIYLETNFEEELNFPNVKLLTLDEYKEVNELIINGEEAYGDALLGEDFVSINGKYIRLVNLYEFSKTLMPSALMDYGDYCVFFKKLDPLVSKRRMNTQRKLHHSNLYSNIRNLESEASFVEAEKMTEAMMEGSEGLFEVEAWFILKADTQMDLNLKTKELIGFLKQAEFTPYIEAESLYELFPSVLAGVAPLFKRSHQTPTSFLANMLPFRHDEIHQEGMRFLSTRGNPLYFNLFDESALNFNVLISGQSGAGKSMIAQKILVDELMSDASVVVLDLGNSFKKTAEYYGGKSLSLSFNPLQFRSPHYLKEFIISVIPANELSAKMEGQIFLLVKENLEHVSTFKELIDKVSSQIPDLGLYFSELWDYFDGAPRDLTKFTYVDTSLYPDKIKAPLIIFLIEAFKNLEGKRIFIFDEVWHFLNNNAEYIAECFRTFRKSGASAIAISQALSDFSASDLGSVIAKLSTTKILFQQSAEVSSELDRFDVEKIKMLSTKRKVYSEFYIKTEHHRKTARFYPAPLEYELFTSSHKDRESFDRFFNHYAEFFPLGDIVDRYVDFKYFHGGINA
ncbi:MAG: VirB4 family type IV secretion system protein [Bacteriovorax sp.]